MSSFLRPTSVLGTVAVLGTAVLLSGCATGAATNGEAGPTASSESVVVETINGNIEVPVSPERVVALDNTSFETLRDWGITPVAVPKALLPKQGFEEWIENDEILDVGTHREPNLEVVSEAEPDLILGGYRFQDHQDDLEQIAVTADLAANEEFEGGWVESLKNQTTQLGEIFEKPDEAADLVAELEDAEAAAADATSGESVFLAVVAGGRIDNGAERIGRILEPLDLVDVFAGEAGDIHGDSGLAPETIAQADPEWVIVLDRDAVAGEGDVLPAEQVFAAQEAFAGTTFTEKDQIIYLDPFFYTREGIQAYTEAYVQVTEAFAS